MFIGTYYHALDEKNRVAVPVHFRPELSSQSVITRGLDGCLFIFTADSWSKLIAKLETLPLTSKSARDFLRLLTYNAVPLDIDSHGRTLLPPHLLDIANLKKEVVFAGALTRIEVWDKSVYHAYVDGLAQSETDLSDAMQELGI